jgi:hypothetical protein
MPCHQELRSNQCQLWTQSPLQQRAMHDEKENLLKVKQDSEIDGQHNP